jgi:hypothetical protein
VRCNRRETRHRSFVSTYCHFLLVVVFNDLVLIIVSVCECVYKSLFCGKKTSFNLLFYLNVLVSDGHVIERDVKSAC